MGLINAATMSAVTTVAETTAATTTSASGFDAMGFMQLFGIIIGVYLFYAGCSGKGAAYNDSYPERLKKEIHQILRKFYIAIGAIMTVGGILEYLNVFGEATKYVFWIYTGLSAILLVTYVIIIKVKYGKQMK